MLPAKKVTIKPPEQPYEHDKAKKIYRSVCDIIKRLDDAQTKKKAFRDAFLPEVIFLRGRLQEYCEKLMFTWPLEYGRKAEEMIWRKGFYDVIQLIKGNVKEVRLDGRIDKAFKTHLSAGIGYYTRLLLQIQSKFEVQVGDAIDLGVIFTNDFLSDKREKKPEAKTAIQNWATQACFRSLVYLGDIARYEYDYGCMTKMIAQRYYYQSLKVCPGLGMPFNQLGTLAGMSAYGFHAAYYYVRCLVSSTPFEGANNNLMKLFEKNRKMLSDFEAVENSSHHSLSHNFHYRHPRRNAPSHARSKDNKRFLLRFIHLVELFFTTSKECDKSHVYELCQVVLDDFDRCLKSNLTKNQSSSSSSSFKRDRGQSSEERQNVVDDEVVFKVFVACLASINHLSKRGHDLVAAAIAFSLAMFSHALNYTITKLHPLSHENVDEFDPDDLTSQPPPRKYSSVRSIESKVCSKIEESHDDGGDDDDEGGGGAKGVVLKEETEVKKYDVGADDGDDSDGDVSTLLESPQNKRKMENKKKKVALSSRRRKRGSDDGDDDDEEGKTGSDDDDDYGGNDYDADNLSSEVESEGALSDFDLLSSSDEGSGMESQPEEEEEPVRVPAYHKKTNSNNKVNKKSPIIEAQKPNEPIKVENTNEPPPVVKCEDEVTKTVGTSPNQSCHELNGVSGTWMHDAAMLLGMTLKMSYFKVEGGDDILRGNKNVPVPPGFERSLELHHVIEITEKLENFNIETDTDVNQSDGDEATGYHSDAEREAEMEKKRQENHKKEVTRLLNMTTCERLLEPVKIFIEWMMVNPSIISSCAKISSSIWYRLATLLNLLPTENDLQNDSSTKNKNFSNILMRELKNETNPGRRVFPMTEDIHLLEFPPLKTAHQKIDHGLQEFLNEKQEAIIRLCRLRMLCRWLSTLEGVDFNYERDSDSFKGPNVATKITKIVPTNKIDANRLNNNSKMNTTLMMKNLAQVRVKSQSGRDRSNREVAPHGLPVYLVPDTESIYEGLKLMKKMTHQEKLKIVVPKVVLSSLDSIKMMNRMTKKAVEWVEEMVYKNDRSQMRLQKSHETCLPPSADSKHNKDDHILRIIDCCHYLSRHDISSPPTETTPSNEARNSICLLTWMTLDTPELSDKVKHALEDALQKGITIKTITAFSHQWQQMSSSIL